MGKRILYGMLVIVLLLFSFSGCLETDSPDEDNSEDGDDIVLAPPDSEAENDGESGNEAPSEEEPDDSETVIQTTATVPFTALGLRVSSYTVTRPDVADFELLEESMKISSRNVGTTTVNVKDCFGHTASYTVKVAKNHSITTAVIKCTEEFLEVSQFGAKGNGRTDDTAAFQAALDAARPGDTVYVYPGFYKASWLAIREGVTLKMYTTMTDATKGYTDSLANDVKRGRVAVMLGACLMNNDRYGHGSEGSDNFTIEGGVWDRQGGESGVFILGCADNIRLEGIVFKDIKGNHVIQFTGCTNVSVVNCMFAGYEVGDTFTREVVQIEPSTPGSTGSGANPPLRFYDGEYVCPKNVTLDGCYFGKSDERGAPLIAIGHHSQVGEANVTGLKVLNTVFDECVYAAIRYDNIVDTVISGNTFISTSAYPNDTGFTDETTPAFIVLYNKDTKTTYTDIIEGKEITEAKHCEQAGIQNLKIVNNTFTLGAGTDKMIMYYKSAFDNHMPGAQYTSAIYRQDEYNSTPYEYSGYLVETNYGRNVSFNNNVVNIEGQPAYSDHFMYVRGVYNFSCVSNTYNLANGVAFSNSYETQSGLFFEDLHSEEESKTYTIDARNVAQRIYIRVGGEIITAITTTARFDLKIKAKAGGDLVCSTDKDGNLYLDAVCDTGYRFKALSTAGGGDVASSVSLSAATTLEVSFAEA